MKDYKVILFVLLVFVLLFGVFRYVLSLKEENDLLMTNINQINGRITLLESAEKTKENMALKTENIVLKEQIAILRSELSRVSRDKLIPRRKELDKHMPQAARGVSRRDKTGMGNRGFMTKCGRSTYP